MLAFSQFQLPLGCKKFTVRNLQLTFMTSCSKLNWCSFRFISVGRKCYSLLLLICRQGWKSGTPSPAQWLITRDGHRPDPEPKSRPDFVQFRPVYQGLANMAPQAFLLNVQLGLAQGSEPACPCHFWVHVHEPEVTQGWCQHVRGWHLTPPRSSKWTSLIQFNYWSGDWVFNLVQWCWAHPY